MQQEKQPYTFTPHDLRIGNVVNSHSSEDGLLPKTIDGQDIVILEVHPNYFNDHHSPIPITVEMLVEELGYNCLNPHEYYYHETAEYGGIKFHEGRFYLCFVSEKRKNKFTFLLSRDFTYLHELQNLHYDFTREMLTLKSKEK